MTGGPTRSAGSEGVTVGHHAVDGDASGRVVLLHGLANNSLIWSPLLSRGGFAAEAWTVDLPWRNDGPPGWSHHGNLTGPVADALGAIPGGCGVVVAHSFTATVLLRLLTAEMGKGVDPFDRYGITGLVAVTPFYRRRPEDFGAETVTELYENYVRIMEEGIRVQLRRPTAPDVVHDMARRVCDRVGPYGWVRLAETYLATPWLRPDLITLPTLVVSGRSDTAVTEAETLAGLLPRGGFEVGQRCGHFPMVEDVDWFAGLLGGFVGSVVNPSGSRVGSAR